MATFSEVEMPMSPKSPLFDVGNAGTKLTMEILFIKSEDQWNEIGNTFKYIKILKIINVL